MWQSVVESTGAKRSVAKEKWIDSEIYLKKRYSIIPINVKAAAK